MGEYVKDAGAQLRRKVSSALKRYLLCRARLLRVPLPGGTCRVFGSPDQCLGSLSGYSPECTGRCFVLERCRSCGALDSVSRAASHLAGRRVTGALFHAELMKECLSCCIPDTVERLFDSAVLHYDKTFFEGRCVAPNMLSQPPLDWLLALWATLSCEWSATAALDRNMSRRHPVSRAYCDADLAWPVVRERSSGAGNSACSRSA